jgi:hypothetical protein
MADHEELANLSDNSHDLHKVAPSTPESSTAASFPRVSESPQVSSRPQVLLSKKRYYVITVGKCAGVFYGEW